MRSMTEEVVPLTEGSESQLSFGEATSSAPSGHLPLNRAFQALGKAFGGRSGDRPYGMGGRRNAAPAARASDARRYGDRGRSGDRPYGVGGRRNAAPAGSEDDARCRGRPGKPIVSCPLASEFALLIGSHASIVDIVSVVSSSTSSSTRTVSRLVNMVTLFSVAARRIFTPSERALLELTLRVLMT